MSAKLQRLSAEGVKAAAAGRWPEILAVVGGIPSELLDRKGHPCPKCGGRDRFSLIDEAAGAVLCRKCFTSQNGDGLAAVAWMRGCDFITALDGVADYLDLTSIVTNGKCKIAAEYDYRDEAGGLLFQVVRYHPKEFRQRRPKHRGGWEWSVKGMRVVPYHLPELMAQPTQLVAVVEGEKDADALASVGVLATCNAGGAGKWSADHAEFLRGRRVIVVPDNDDAGRKHAEQVARTLHGVAESVRVVELPGLPPKGDASDWLAAGGTRQELERLVEDAPEWRPTPVLEAGPILTCFADVEPQSVSWLWPGRIPLGRITLLVGRPGEGKSFLTTDIAGRVTTGTPWPDGSECPQGSVILISAEDDPADTIRPRLDAHGADVARVHLLSAVQTFDGSGPHEQMISLADVDAIELALKRIPDCKLIVVDPIGSFLGGGTDANRDNEVRGILAPIALLAKKLGVAVLVVAHRRKSTGTNADDLALGSVAFTAIARAVWHLSRDDENKGRRLLLPGKNNLAGDGGGLAFSISGKPPGIVWEPDPVEMNANEALAAENKTNNQKPGPEPEALNAATDWLRSALANGPRPATELLDQWCTGECGSKRTLDRAKRAAGVVSYRPNGTGPWWWRLPPEDGKAHEGVDPGDLGNLGDNSHDTLSFVADEGKDAKLSEPGNLGSERVRVTI